MWTTPICKSEASGTLSFEDWGRCKDKLTHQTKLSVSVYVYTFYTVYFTHVLFRCLSKGLSKPNQTVHADTARKPFHHQSLNASENAADMADLFEVFDWLFSKIFTDFCP